MNKYFGKLKRIVKRLVDFPAPPINHPPEVISKDLFKRYLPKRPVIVEAGAQGGEDTIEFAEMWPKGTIHAFEPVPSMFSELAKKVSSYRNVHIYPMALGGTPGDKPMWVSSGASTGSSSLLRPLDHLKIHPLVAFDSQIMVPVTTLEDFRRDQNIDHIDMLWLDLQGSEWDVLNASQGLLDGVLLIHTEVSLLPMYEGTPLYPEFRKWLEERGFRVIHEALPNKDMGNVVFAKKS